MTKLVCTNCLETLTMKTIQKFIFDLPLRSLYKENQILKQKLEKIQSLLIVGKNEMQSLNFDSETPSARDHRLLKEISNIIFDNN